MGKDIEEQLLASVLTHSYVGFVLFSVERKVIFINDIIEKFCGFKKNELLDTQFFDVIVKDSKYLKLVLNKLEGCFNNRPFDDFDLTIEHRNGKKVILHMSGSFMKQGEHTFTLLVIQDITRKKEFEKVIESTYDNIMQSTIDLDAALKKIKEQRRVLEEYKSKMEQELNIAMTVQKTIMPKEFLSNENVRVWGISIPNKELGGDYFDFFSPDNSKLGILIADVSGHGVPSALITTMIKVYFERYAKEFVEPERVFSLINNEVTKTLQETGFYFTAFYSILDLDTMTITSTSAGHDFAICYDSKKNKIYELGKTDKGTIIGTFEEAEYDSSTFQLEAGYKVIYFTDGITEARNKQGDFFGVERVVKMFKEKKDLSPKDFIALLIKEVDEFSEGSTSKDDRTLIVLEILKRPQPSELSKNDIKRIVDMAFKNGRKYVKEKQYSAAINEFLKIIKFDKKSSGAYSYLGQMFGIFGDFKKAENCLHKAIELDNSYVQGYYFLGIILYKQEKYKEAKECWMKLKDLAGDFKNVDIYIQKIEKLGF